MRHGFTLIELLVALVILASGIVLVLEAFETSLSALGESRVALRAGSLIRELMAESELDLAAGGTGEWISLPRLEQDFPGYRWAVDVRRASDIPVAAGASNELRQVAITVRHDASGREYGAVTYFTAPVTSL